MKAFHILVLFALTTGPSWLRGADVGEPSPAILKGHSDHVRCLAFSPDGKMLVSGGFDKKVRFWDVPGRKMLAVFKGHTEPVIAVAFSPDGKTAASGSADKTVRVLEAATAKELDTFHGHEKVIREVAFLPDGKSLLSSGLDATIRVWTSGNDAATHTFETDAPVFAMAVAPDGKRFATTGFGKTSRGMIRLWNLQEKKPAAEFPADPSKSAVLSLVFMPAGKSLAGTTQEVMVWNPATGRVLAALKSDWAVLHILRLDATGRFSAVSSTKREGDKLHQEVRLFDLAAKKELATVHKGTHMRPFLGFAFSPDGSILAVGNDDGTIALVDVARYTRNK